MGEPRKVYVTKYAMTEGILHCTVNEEWTGRAEDSGRVYVDWPRGLNDVADFSGGEWAATLEAAQARVGEMVKAKLKSLDKQRMKLEKFALNGAKVVVK